MLNVSRHFMVNQLRLNLSSNSGFVYQGPLQKKAPGSAESANARQERFPVESAAEPYAVQSVSTPAVVFENSPVAVFKMPALSELPTRKQKALLAYQSVATNLPPVALEIAGIDLYV